MAVVMKNSTRTASGATVAYVAQHWQMADARHSSMDAAQHKHLVLGLAFLKYITLLSSNTSVSKPSGPMVP